MSETNNYATPQQPFTPDQEKLFSMLTHIVPIFGLELLAPLVAYWTLKDRGPFIKHHVTESLNFAISIIIYAIPVYIVLAISVVGWFLFWLPPVIAVAIRIYAGVQAFSGQFYKYPLTIKFVS